MDGTPAHRAADLPLWRPDPQRLAEARMSQFRNRYSEEAGVEVEDSGHLGDCARDAPDTFWSAVWKDCGVVGDPGPRAARNGHDAAESTKAVRAFVPGDGIVDACFFPDARLNYAENLLAGGQRPGAEDVAVVFRREDGVRRKLTWAQLRSRSHGLADELRELGVGRGDRVAAWMPNTPEALIAMLATSLVGAVFTSTSPDFGVAGVLDRFGQVEPTVLLAADGYVYAGKRQDRLPLLPEVLAGLPGLGAVLVVPELDSAAEVETRLSQLGLAPDGATEVRVRVYRPGGVHAVNEAADRIPFDAPGFILYSSGTTGVPKCIVHSGAGILLKHLTEHQLHCDVRPGDRVFYFTTCGWMMWNWLVSALASGATIVLYDGSPFHPGPAAMWDLAEQEGVTLFGTSAKYLDACSKAGLVPRNTHDLSALRTITSTGSPLSHEGFEYVYRDVATDVHLASISGGTDLCGCFVIGDPTRPVYAGEIQGPALGTAVDVWDENGNSLADQPGKRGELVCTRPFPSMPLGFFGDDDGSRYREAYFSRFPGVWVHGDFASRTEHGGFIIHGRSDATLNAGGVRIGTAEIYRQVDQFDEVLESLAIGQEWDDDTRVVLFVRLAPGACLDDDLVRRLKGQLRSQCSPRHVPARILAVADLPRTRSGKLAELAVADVVHGREVRNVGALANPESLDLFADLPMLHDPAGT